MYTHDIRYTVINNIECKVLNTHILYLYAKHARWYIYICICICIYIDIHPNKTRKTGNIMCMLFSNKWQKQSWFYSILSSFFLTSFYLAYTINNYRCYIFFHIHLYLFIQILENVIVISMILLSLAVIYYFVCMYKYRFFPSLSLSLSPTFFTSYSTILSLSLNIK